MKNNILQQIHEVISGGAPQKKLQLTEKKQALAEIQNYQAIGEVIYRSEGLKEAATRISKIVESAEQLVLQETEEWFDEVTIKRNMKELSSKNQEFTKTVSEISKLQQRLESLYEEMGNGLSRYYEIGNK
jgi:hypothetical protein